MKTAKLGSSLLKGLAIVGAMVIVRPALAQETILSTTQYAQLKAAGALPANAVPESLPLPTDVTPSGDPSRGGGGNVCECWQEPDASYTLAMPPNDDGSSGVITLPFQFSLYGDLYSAVYINNNGNLSFQQAFGTFTSTGFPNATNRMVAPFWADVETQFGQGQVWYKVTPTAMYVNWVDVGYYSAGGAMPNNANYRNSFQVVITNGQDPAIGVGSNVQFCYLDMQWTTGTASGGSGGFGGTPATVGANRALNTGDYIQFGRFGVNSAIYDGPFGNTDGIDWLDDKSFVFNTAVSTQNIPPIATGQYLCDTLRACVGQISEIEVTFLAPENGQIVTTTTTAPTLSNWVETNNTSGIFSSVTGQFQATLADVGYHIVTFTATDNGVPNLSSTVDIIIEVIDIPTDPLVITGNSAICAGQTTVLTATPGYGSYTWSNGQTGQTITISQPGTYTVSSAAGLCEFVSPPFTVAVVNAPALSITGPAQYCGVPLPTLQASPGFDSYTWNTGDTGESLETSGGTFTVTGQFQGCETTSQPFVLTEVDPGPPVITGESQYCEGGNVTLSTDASPYSTIEWSSGQTAASIIATSGTYTVSATFLNCSYVSDPFIVEEVILPEVAITGDTTFCSGSLSFLNATPGFETYTWNNGSTGANISVQAGTYFVTATIGPCSTSSLTFSVTEVPNPTPVITGPTVGCGGTPLVLSTTQAFTSFAWSNSDTTSTTQVLTGTYTVTVTNQFGCTGTSAPFSVVVDEYPLADFSTDPPSPQLPNTTVDFTDESDPNGGTITGWSWDFGVANGTASTQNPSWTYPLSGEYSVTLIVTTANGCVDTVTVQYIIRPAEISIPNVFSPNNDGMNDSFNIENIEFFQNEVTVFNRWGQALLEAKNYRNTWRAIDVPDGTYYYVVRLNNDGREYTGHVTILR
jgi:gliding motility-associated-like protein